MSTVTDPGVQRTPLRGMRAMIAGAMRKSLDEAAQLTHHGHCDVSNLLTRKQQLAQSGLKVSMEDLLAHTVSQALQRHPLLNGRLEGNELHHHRHVHLSFAIGLSDTQLVAPALFDVDTMTLEQLASARRDLVERARSGQLSVKEMTGGTFTLSNLGRSRVELFTPVINLPQLAILGIGRTQMTPTTNEAGELEIRPMMGLSLTFDHRAVDGGPAADFFDTLCRLLEGGADEHL